MAIGHLLATLASTNARIGQRIESSRPGSGRLAHLTGMTTHHAFAMVPSVLPMAPDDRLQAVLSLSELADYLRVPTQTLYDLRATGRGPRGFRVGRRLQFRLGEVEAWLTSLEDQDEAHRQQIGGAR